MGQPLLSDVEIAECVAALLSSVEAIQHIQSTMKGGKHVQLPKLPSILSESLVSREIQQGRSPFWNGPLRVARGGRDADLAVTTTDRRHLIEVKATGRQGFQYFYKKDINADFIVWVAFGDGLETGLLEPVPAYWLQTPSRFWVEPLKISLPAFLKAGGPEIRTTTISVR
ncbi:MAG: hypothetical protein ACYDDF_05215 [Thermoplasmatota archaeon]